MKEALTADQRALANLLDAVEGVLAYEWCDNDSDAVEAIERLRKANDDYGVVQRLAADVPATLPCEHKWVSARNEAVSSGEICVKCCAIRAEITRGCSE